MEHSLPKYKDFIDRTSALLGLLCVVAGGAVRDVILDRAEYVQDLDVWLYAPDLEATRETVLNSGFFGRLLRRLGNERANLGRDGAIIAIDYYDLRGQEINLIYLKEPIRSIKDLLKDFDFGVNQAGICPVHGLVMTDAFQEAISDHILRVTRKDDPERAEMRLAKMQDKFPLWSVVDSAPKRTTPSKPLNYGYP